MSPASGQRLAELVLTASVARRYYLAGRSKSEIAQELRLSRFQVARLLDKALASGLVRIEIGQPGVVDLEASSRLQDELGLQHAVVVDVPEDDVGPLRSQLGAVAAQLLAEVLTPRDVLGLAWARAVSALVAAGPALPSVPVVQLTGAMSGRDFDDSAVEVVRELARSTGAPAHVFYAPMLVQDAATARALRAQPEVAGAFRQFGAVTRAVVGIGRWLPGESTLYALATPRERALLHDLGVVAEFSGVLVCEDGTHVQAELTERMVAITGAELRAIPDVLAIAYGGQQKVPAVRAAVRSGLVTSLVTHASLAAQLLAGA